MSKLKGVSLSIETIIIIVICVLVLVVVILFFTGIFNPSGEGLTSEANLWRECMDWQKSGFDYTEFDNYPGLNEKYKVEIVAENVCRGIMSVNYVECDDCSCFGTQPTDYVCCCEGKEAADCSSCTGCKWAPSCG